MGLLKFNVALRPQRPQGLLGRDGGAQDGHLDFHTAPELCHECVSELLLLNVHGGEKAY